MTATVVSAEEPTTRAHAPWWQRRATSAVLLTVVLFLLAQLGDPDGYLSTDVGGKTATIAVIVEDGPIAPDLGYWAEDLDPDGRLYPMWSTAKIGDAWVNATSLPMLYLAAPLWSVGGPRLALLIPVLGTVLAALGAASLARRMGATVERSAVAFWTIGLASPATIYALDLWEHSLGLGLITWGVIGVVDATARSRVRAWVPVAAGLAFSVAASMRQEALVYGFVAGAALVMTLLSARRPLTAMGRSLGLLVGTAAGIVANVALERVVFGAAQRAGRGTGTASTAGSDLGVRAKEAIITAAGPLAGLSTLQLTVAVLLLALLVALAVRADEPFEKQRTLWIGLGAIGVLVLADLVVDGMRFIPGLAATTPLAVLGAVRGWLPGPRRLVTAVGVGALPIVWLTQFAGGASAQWGGRYTLASGLLLAVVAVVSCDTGNARRTCDRLIAVSAVIAVIGVGWTVVRTHGFGSAGRALADRPEEVLVFHDPFVAREPGPLGLDRQWLAAPTEELVLEAAVLLQDAGVERVGYVDFAIGRKAPDLPGYEPVGESRIDLVNDLQLLVTSFELSD